ncbi:MAG: DUF5009 domain-containing protein [Planctomycetota bacterium]
MSESAGESGSGGGRITSIDALRGFDMMLIVGGREAILGLTLAFGLDRTHEVLLGQFEHPAWNGFTAWDMIFPLFLFLAGASLPFSFAKRRERGDSRKRLALHAVRRGLVLALLGVVYNGLLALDLESLRVASVLGRIGLAWAGAALVVLFLGVRGQAIALAAVLLAHSVAILFVPAPGLDAASLEPGQTFGDWVDRQLTPGRLYKGDRDPEGVFGILPAIGTALLGSFAGRWIGRRELSDGARLGGLVGGGIACLALGGALDLAGLPINKNLWTASFVLWAGGWSLLLLALFHFVFDVRRADRLALVFTVVGANAILAYLAGAFIDVRDVVELVMGRGLERGKLHPALVPVLALALQWVVLAFLYRRRVFLRV